MVSSTGANLVEARTRRIDFKSEREAKEAASWLRNLDRLEFIKDETQHIVHIDLSLNYLERVPPELVELFSKDLISLDLSLNRMSQLDGKRLKLPGLKLLRLGRNDITTLYPSSFAFLESLVELDLSRNKIASLPHLAGLVSLKSLNLRMNELEVLQNIPDLPKLEELDVSNNKLVDIINLTSVNTLVTLDLSSNQLDDLEEVRDILFGLDRLTELKAANNPICSSRNYRMRILENENIIKLDNFKVTKGLRKEWKDVKAQEDLDHVIVETTMHYMGWIEKEAEAKQNAINILRRKEAQIEEAFGKYRKTMEQELEECVQYIQEVAHDPNKLHGSYLASFKGQKDFATILKRAEETRKTTYDAELDKFKAELEDQVVLKEETEGYIKKLNILSKSRPSIWQQIKHRELSDRGNEEANERALAEEHASERTRVRARLSQRAEDRNKLLLQAPGFRDVRLRARAVPLSLVSEEKAADVIAEAGSDAEEGSIENSARSSESKQSDGASTNSTDEAKT